MGQFTNWVQGTTTASFGAGVTVASFTVNATTSATAVLNIDPAAATGARTITLTTGTEVDTLTNGFTVAAGTPVLLSVNPIGGKQGQSLQVNIAGQFTNFVQGTSQVSFGLGIAVGTVTVANATSLTAQITIPANAPLGPVTVTVTTGTEVASLANGFMVTAGTPVLLSATPNSGQVGQQNLSVALAGQFTNWVQGTTTASFGAAITVASLTVTSPTTATAVVNINAAAATGTRTITLTTGSEIDALANGFTVTAGTPVLLSATPNSGQVGQQNLSVALAGQFTNWVQGTATASFGAGITVVLLTVNSPTTATAAVNINSAAATGTRTVTLTTGSEIDTLANGFTVTAGSSVPDLTITKSHTGNFIQGQTGTYTITVTNSGTSPTTGTVSMSDTIPTGLTTTAIAGTGWSCTLATSTCTRSDALVAVASYAPITVSVSVANNAPAAVTNTATVSGGGETDTSNDTSTDPTTIVAVSNLSLNKPATQSSNYPGYASAIAASAVDGNTDGNFFDGSVTATNLDTNAWWQVDLGASAIVNSIVIWNRTDCCADRLGDYWIFVSSTPFGPTDTPTTLQSRAETWSSHQTTIPSPSTSVLASGAQGQYVRVQLSGTNYLSLAEVQVMGVIGGSPNPDLTITKTHVGNFTQGQTGAAYTISVSNGGAEPTTGTVTVTDTLPTGLTATSIAGTGWGCTLAGLNCTRSDALAVSASYPPITLTVNVANTAPASVTNTAVVSGGGETITTNDTASDVTVVNPMAAAIPVITAISPKSALANTTATLTISGANLTGSTFAFSPSTNISISASTIASGGTSATLTVNIATAATGRFTLIGTNGAGSSDPTVKLGFVESSGAFNTLTVPGANPNADPDGDNLTNAQEISLGSDPLNPDTDGDGYPDGL